MKKHFLVLSVLLLAAAAVFAASDAGLSGDYVEVRTADIYTGPCFANAETNLAGKEAILAWRVSEGAWRGVNLDGLGVVAVVKADFTLGDPFALGTETRSMLVIDERASRRQSEALEGLAREMAGPLLDQVVRVESAPIQVEVGGHGQAYLRAGQIAEVKTRGLHSGDHLCGNEIVYYPPLAAVEAMPAYTEIHNFSGEGLNSGWRSPFKRSAFVGHFRR